MCAAQPQDNTRLGAPTVVALRQLLSHVCCYANHIAPQLLHDVNPTCRLKQNSGTMATELIKHANRGYSRSRYELGTHLFLTIKKK